MCTPRQVQYFKDEGFEEPRISTGRSTSRWEFAKVVLASRLFPSTLCSDVEPAFGLGEELRKRAEAGGA